MDAALIGLVVLVIGLIAAAGWLVVERGRLAARAAADGAMLEAERRARESAEGEVAAARGEMDEMRAEGSALRVQAAELRKEIEREQQVHATELASVKREKETIEKKLAEFDEKMRAAFGTLAADALGRSTAELLKLAEQRLGAQSKEARAELDGRKSVIDEQVKAIKDTLAKTELKLAEIERDRTGAYASLKQLVEAGTRASAELVAETGKLAQALRKPHVRGRYGEIQLRRCAELAGMTGYCDFAEQDQTRDADGNALRPDMVVRLPSERTIVVDAKTNIEAYIDAVNCADAAQADGHLERFARHVAEQAGALARKRYWTQYDGSPEFVVMFIPGDQFIDAALSRQSDLLERAAEQGVLLASPSTLIGLLRAVAVGYQEQRLATAAEELRDLGRQLHERAAVAMGHAARIGKALGAAVDGYNDFVGSYEKRLEPVLRKFEESGVKSGKELPELGAVEVRARLLESSANHSG